MAAEAIATIPVDGGRIAYRRLGSGQPLIVLNGLAATSADWDPSFIDRLASGNEIILLDNRGIGASTDDGAPFDIAKLAGDTARVIEALEFERASVLGWSMGGFIAQTLAFNDPARVHKLILLSTDPGGTAAELASPAVLEQLTDTSGTPHELAGYSSCCFPAILPSPSTASSVTWWPPHAPSSLATSSIGRPLRWTHGTTTAPATGSAS